jgi:predicted Zn finger-like uncharacterized protein
VEKIITQCPHCKSKFKLGNDKLGKKIRCPKCKGVFEVQEIGAKPKAAAPPAQSKPQAPKPGPTRAAPVAKTPATAASQPAPAAQDVVPIEQRPRPLQPKDFFETQHMRFLPEKAQGVNAHIWYEITGESGGSWTVIIRNGGCELKEGPDPGAKTHVKMSAKTYMKIALGKLDSRVAFMLGKIRIKGDKQSVVSVRECFKVADVKE